MRKGTSQTAKLRASPLVSLVGTGFDRAMSPLPSLLTLKRLVISTFIGRCLSVDVGEVSRHAVDSAKRGLASLPRLLTGAPKGTFLILVADREDWAICCPAS